MNPQPEHFAQITTPRGSIVHFTGTAQQMNAIREQYGPVAEPPAAPADAASGNQKQCGQCQGKGGWYETVKVKTPSGGEVVTQKWVNCRPCGGTGKS